MISSWPPHVLTEMDVNYPVDQSMDPANVIGCNADTSLRIKKNGVAVIVVMHVNTLGNADEASFRPGTWNHFQFTVYEIARLFSGLHPPFFKNQKTKKKKAIDFGLRPSELQKLQRAISQISS